MYSGHLATRTHGDLRYYDSGAGANALVLIHGLGNSLGFWAPVVERVNERRVIAVDLPGYGGSRGPTEVTPAGMVTPIADLLRDLDAFPCVAAGHSLGGVVALHLATLAPSDVSTVVLVDGHLFSANDLLAGRTSVLANPALAVALGAQFIGGMLPMKGPVLTAVTSTRLARTLLLWPFLAKPAAQSPARLKRALRGNVGGGAVIQLFRLARSYDLRATARDVACTVDVVWGDGDRLLRDEDHQEIARLARVRRTCLVADAGHWSLIEQPAVIAEFLTSA